MIDSLIYSEAEGMVRVTLSGDLDVEDFREAMGEVVRIRATVGPTHSVWDVTALDFTGIDIGVLRSLSHARASFAPRGRGERVAIVVPGTIEQSIMKLFLDLSEEIENQQRVFTNRADAERWCLTGAELA